MSDGVILIGGGGHAKVVADVVLASGDRILGFLDDDPENNDLFGYPSLGMVSDWARYAGTALFILAVGSNLLRESLKRSMDVHWYTAVHPSAQIGTAVKIGAGSVIMANAALNPDSSVGMHCIINTGAIIEHDNHIADYVHISPRAVLCGGVTVGTRTHVGAGAVVINNISVCSDVIVGAGAAVVEDITEPGTYVGVPARRLH